MGNFAGTGGYGNPYQGGLYSQAALGGQLLAQQQAQILGQQSNALQGQSPMGQSAIEWPSPKEERVREDTPVVKELQDPDEARFKNLEFET
jgi:hypothetical protein